MRSRTVADLVQIAANGGGFAVDASQISTEHIVQILANSHTKLPHIVIKNAGVLAQAQLVRIAANSGGNVFFEW